MGEDYTWSKAVIHGVGMQSPDRILLRKYILQHSHWEKMLHCTKAFSPHSQMGRCGVKGRGGGGNGGRGQQGQERRVGCGCRGDHTAGGPAWKGHPVGLSTALTSHTGLWGNMDIYPRSGSWKENSADSGCELRNHLLHESKHILTGEKPAIFSSVNTLLPKPHGRRDPGVGCRSLATVRARINGGSCCPRASLVRYTHPLLPNFTASSTSRPQHISQRKRGNSAQADPGSGSPEQSCKHDPPLWDARPVTSAHTLH